MENYFNLVEEKWIPLELEGRASLLDAFNPVSSSRIGGNAIQKFALIKLLLAIAQTCWTPEDDGEWASEGLEGMCRKCNEYLLQKRDLFFLYGERPFLQFPKLLECGLKPKDIGNCLIPDLLSDNNSILNSFLLPKKVSDAEKAVFLVTLMNYSLAGKRVDGLSPVFSPGYNTKKKTAKPGPSIGNYVGYLQTCFLGQNIAETVWLNLFSKISIERYLPEELYSVGTPPWEKMPSGEDDSVAKCLKNSFMGTLCAVSRFVFFTRENGIIYTGGVEYPSHKEGWREPFMSYDLGEKVAWVDPTRRPWRNLNAILGFAILDSGKDGFDCPQISLLFNRNRRAKNSLGILSGGLKVRANAGDQSVKQDDDFVDDQVFLRTRDIDSSWYMKLNNEFVELDGLAKRVFGSVSSYYKKLSVPRGKEKAQKAVFEFWSRCEAKKEELFSGEYSDECIKQRRVYFAHCASDAFDEYCPRETAKQMCAWAKCRPSFSKYLDMKER